MSETLAQQAQRKELQDSLQQINQRMEDCFDKIATAQEKPTGPIFRVPVRRKLVFEGIIDGPTISANGGEEFRVLNRDPLTNELFIIECIKDTNDKVCQ